MNAESLLIALGLLNSAGILPALWLMVRFAWRLDRRITRVEWHLGLDRRGGGDTT